MVVVYLIKFVCGRGVEDDGIGGGVDEKEEVGVFPMSVFQIVNTPGKSRVLNLWLKKQSALSLK